MQMPELGRHFLLKWQEEDAAELGVPTPAIALPDGSACRSDMGDGGYGAMKRSKPNELEDPSGMLITRLIVFFRFYFLHV